MAKILTLEEMILALKEYDSKKHDYYKFCIEMVAQKLANDLAEHTGTEAGNAEIWDGGLMCGFAPFSHTQDLPGALDPFDPEGEWVPREPKVGELVKTTVPLHLDGANRLAGRIGRFIEDKTSR